MRSRSKNVRSDPLPITRVGFSHNPHAIAHATPFSFGWEYSQCQR